MIAFVALLVGYVIGAKAGSDDLDEVFGALKRLGQSEEMADVVSAARSHLGHTLRELASVVDRTTEPSEEAGDLVDRVRHLFAGDAQSVG
jgi:hypothetical protein